MTDKLTQEIRIPSWMFGSVIVAFLAFMGYMTTQTKSNQDIATRVEYSAKERSEMKIDLSRKADRSEIDRIYDKLDKMNDKLDKLIEK